jgi:hypothetical protein
VRNFCPICGGLVFAGESGKTAALDDPSSFHLRAAIFALSRPHRALIPSGLTVFEEMPPQDHARQNKL